MDDDRLLKLIQQIYEVPGDKAAWERLVARIAEAFDAEHGHYAVVDLNGPRILCDFVTSNEAGEAYARHYAPHDTAVHRLVRGADRQAVTQLDLMSDDEVKACPVHQELLPRFDADHRLWVKSHLGDGLTFLSTALRSRRRGAFSGRDYRLMELLHPHTERAMRLHLELSQARARAASLESGLDTLACGLVLLDGRGAVLHANRTARAILNGRDGLMLECGQLAATAAAARARLQKLLAQALGIAGPTVGGGVALPRHKGRPLVVRALPLARDIDVLTPRAAAVVLIHDPERPLTLDDSWLAELGLSRAEARLVAALASGQSLEDYSRATGLRPSSVRSTLKNAFVKTETHRQGELVSLVLRGAIR